jgi:hypothetical protein
MLEKQPIEPDNQVKEFHSFQLNEDPSINDMHHADDLFGTRLKSEPDNSKKSTYFNYNVLDKAPVILQGQSHGFNSSQIGQKQDKFQLEERKPVLINHVVVLDGYKQEDTSVPQKNQSSEKETPQQIFKPHVNVMKAKSIAGTVCFLVYGLFSKI